jgi:uncharacterized protein (DUF2236 family)
MLAAVGTLPPPIRELHGIPWSPGRRRLAGVSAGTVKRLRPFVPKRLRWVPAALAAERPAAEGEVAAPTAP